MATECEHCPQILTILEEIRDLLKPSAPTESIPVSERESRRTWVARKARTEYPELPGIREFVARCPQGSALEARAFDLYQAYRESTPDPTGPRRFSMALSALGFGSRKGAQGVRIRTGLTVPAS